MFDIVCSIFLALLMITFFLLMIPVLVRMWIDAINDIRDLFDNKLEEMEMSQNE